MDPLLATVNRQQQNCRELKGDYTGAHEIEFLYGGGYQLFQNWGHIRPFLLIHRPPLL
jgi:hypothetical protein